MSRSDETPAIAQPQERRIAGDQARRRSVRFQLLMAVNLVLVAGLLIILGLDFQHERADRLRDTRVALQEEAQLLLPAIRRLARQGPEAVQEYIDAACGRMQETTSPGHHIAVRLGDQVLQARTHHRASPAMFEAMLAASRAADHQVRVGDQVLMVGSDGRDDVSVYVSEYASNVLRAARRRILLRLGGITLLGLIATSVIGFIVVRLVTRPVERLVGVVRRIGEGKWEAHAEKFGSTEFQFLADEIGTMTASLAAADRQRQWQMKKARRIQENLRPSAERFDGWSIASLFQSADEVGGDYLDFRAVGEGKLLACVGDVSGHGVPAAMGAAMLKVLFDAVSRESHDPGEVLSYINRRFTRISLDEDFASMIVVVLDRNARRLCYASAGHEPAYLLRRGSSTQTLGSTGPLLGIDAGEQWQTMDVPMAPGERLVLATDGCAESISTEGKVLGRERFRTALEETAGKPPEAAAGDVADFISAWRSHGSASDDVSLLMIEWPGSRDPLGPEVRATADEGGYAAARDARIGA